MQDIAERSVHIVFCRQHSYVNYVMRYHYTRRACKYLIQDAISRCQGHWKCKPCRVRIYLTFEKTTDTLEDKLHALAEGCSQIALDFEPENSVSFHQVILSYDRFKKCKHCRFDSVFS